MVGVILLRFSEDLHETESLQKIHEKRFTCEYVKTEAVCCLKSNSSVSCRRSDDTAEREVKQMLDTKFNRK